MRRSSSSPSTPSRRRFRNFLSFDRRWREEVGSDDCQGRAVWAAGGVPGPVAAGARLQFWAAQYFEQAVVTTIAAMTALLAWASGLLGIQAIAAGWTAIG